MTNFESVKKFMHTFGQEVRTKAGFPNDKIIGLRLDLIKEELSELKEAVEKKDIKEVADALTDILYVTYGAGHAFGINLDKCFVEVQNSNMSKLGSDGKPIYNENGKVMKGPDYFKPNLNKITLLQLDGKLSQDQFTEAVNMGVSGSKTLYELQKKALMSKYFEKPTGGKKL